MYKDIDCIISAQLGRIEKLLEESPATGLANTQAEEKKRIFLNFLWPEFNAVLAYCRMEVQRRCEAHYSLHERLPPQATIHRLQTLNERLTQYWYGQANANLIYLFIIDATREAGLMSFTADQYHASKLKSHDGVLTIYDANYRENPARKKAFADRNKTFQESYTPAPLKHGKNPLDKLYTPNLLTQQQGQEIRQRNGLITAGLKLKQLAQRKQGRAVYQSWGQMDPAIAQKFLEQATVSENYNHALDALVLHHQQKPGTAFTKTENDIQQSDEGLQSGTLTRATLLNLQDKRPDRYLSFSFQRDVPFRYYQQSGESHVAVARQPGQSETHRIMSNHMPYFQDHGLAIAGAFDRVRDPEAFQPNTRMDVEKLHLMMAHFNPPLPHATLPGEKRLACFQNPRVAASILGTEHSHLVTFDTSRIPILERPDVAQYGDEQVTYRVIQGGTHQDGVVLDVSYADPSQAPIENIVELMTDLRKHFATLHNDPDAIDVSFICFESKGRYHTLLVPMNKLRQDAANRVIYNAHNQPDTDLGLHLYDTLPHPMLGIFRLCYNGDSEKKLQALGGQAITRFFDFVEVDGLQAVLTQRLAQMTCEKKCSQVLSA